MLVTMPRFAYTVDGNTVYGTRAYGYLHKIFPTGYAGSYCLESTGYRNFYETTVYYTEVDFVGLKLLTKWHREASRLSDHPAFRELVDHIRIFGDLYVQGCVQQSLLVRLYACSPIRTAFVVVDDIGAIDLWLPSEGVPLGFYAVFRMLGTRRRQDWHLCRMMRFLRSEAQPPDPRSRM